MFYSIKDIVDQSVAYNGSVSELMIQTEMELSNRSRNEILSIMEKNFQIMQESIQDGLENSPSRTGLSGGDAHRIHQYLNEGNFLSGQTILTAVRNAVATNEVNAKMGLICATPTAGSAGVLPAVLFAAKEKLNLTHEECISFLFTAGAFGLVLANNASISGAEGGCQAEVGSASAMASAALVLHNGGTPTQASHALAMTIKNMLGLICDPVAGLVEVPCVKRNALGSSLAFVSADMALAGVQSKIPPDEVVHCMYQVGKTIPGVFKETAEGGLATTPTGMRYMEDIFGD
ncbi:MAG: L-serine ammonia-lyase, iron-sulfur-dependent, subunit alpha [Streptococcaceae bacterium]|jgi:L-serine dehydratase|nr:L-serine ammonia-lyase, iron-sulfur-dependent, subunit alpha [Streptococcaceae bacterium]